MKLSLAVITTGKAEGQVIPVNLAQFVIGRDSQCNLRPASALISKRHCAVLIRGEKAFLRDFDSTNGTFVNDQPVKNEIEIHDKDRIKVGPLQFEVRIEAKPAVNRPTPPPLTQTTTILSQTCSWTCKTRAAPARPTRPARRSPTAAP